jgi:hypothetical protein
MDCFLLSTKIYNSVDSQFLMWGVMRWTGEKGGAKKDKKVGFPLHSHGIPAFYQ